VHLIREPERPVKDADEFVERFGFAPVDDDIDRVNCSNVGATGHYQCGVCPLHDKPRFSCGCLVRED